jgi:hypothetical protein
LSGFALLIDWDNVRAEQDVAGFHCHSVAELAGGLRTAADELASASGGEVTYAAAFAPPDSFDHSTAAALLAARIEKVETSTKKQAADVAMICKAFLLYHAPDRCEQFIVVSGDGGFPALGDELVALDCRCQIWSFGTRSTSRDVQDWSDKEVLGELLEYQPCPPIAADEVQLLILGCERLMRDGTGIWTYRGAIKRIAHLGVVGDIQHVRTVWDMANASGAFAEDRPGQVTRGQGDRRLAYEDAEVRRYLTLCDILLEAVARGMRLEPKGVPEVRALARLTHPLLQDGERATVLETLVASGLLVRADDRVFLRDVDTDRLGCLTALRRVASIFFTRGTRELTRSNIMDYWVPHVVFGRGRHTSERAAARDAASRLVARAKASGLLIGKGWGTYQLRASHPLVQETERGMAELVRALAAHAGPDTAIPREDARKILAAHVPDDGGTPPFGLTSTEHDAWLALMASNRHLQLSQEVTLWRSDFVQGILNG